MTPPFFFSTVVMYVMGGLIYLFIQHLKKHLQLLKH